MSGQTDTTHDEAASLTAGHAAGYCWVQGPGARGRCTRRPGHDDDHVDYYNGRQSITDVEGYRWPQ
ncbi:hypothetical protein ACFVAF_18310 [Streptomyces sp. NPDC057596]|uniref:hypothetical protein n=1 Tax=Streptomyces sp. NPDC057596 TaxID=3346178 RepID=UPI00368A3004